MNILKVASEKGKVIVGLLTDEAIASYKRVPIMKWNDRKIVIENLVYVDEVISQETLDYTNNLLKKNQNMWSMEMIGRQVFKKILEKK